MLVRARAAGLVVLLCSAAGTAQAQSANGAPVDLAWDAPPECPRRDAVAGEIARILGAARGPRAHVTARVTVRPGGAASWHAELEVETADAQSHRSFDAGTCEAVASAAALIVAVAVDGRLALGAAANTAAAAATPLNGAPTATPAPMSPNPAPAPTAPAAAERSRAAPAAAAASARTASAAPPEKTSPAPTRVSRRGAQLEASVAAAGDLATGPRVAPGGEIALGWVHTGAWWRVRAIAAAQFFAAEASQGPASEPFGATFRLTTISGRACGSIVWNSLDVGPCIGADVDLMSVSDVRGPAEGFTANERGGMWADIAGSILVAAALSERVSVFVRADGVVVVAQPYPQFVVTSTQPTTRPAPVHQPAPFTGRGALGIQVRFF